MSGDGQGSNIEEDSERLNYMRSLLQIPAGCIANDVFSHITVRRLRQTPRFSGLWGRNCIALWVRV